MAKVLLSKLPQAVSEVIGNIYQGVISARDTGIDWARSPDKVDFQAEVILTANDIQREQLEELRGSTKVTEEGEQVTTQVQGPGRSVTTSADSSQSQGQRQSQGQNQSQSQTQGQSQGQRQSQGQNQSNSQGHSNSNSNENSNGNSNNGGSHTTYSYS